MNITYFIVLTSQNWRYDSQVAATELTSCGSHAPPDNLCSIPAESCDCTCFFVRIYQNMEEELSQNHQKFQAFTNSSDHNHTSL